MNRNTLLLIIGVIVIISGIGAYYFQQDDVVKIGYIGSLSGKFSALGSSARNGAILAIEEINSKSGNGGELIHLIVNDDAGIPKNSVTICETFKKENINIIVGPFTTASATAVLPCINKHSILTLGPVTAGENLAGTEDMFIKLFPSTSDFGRETARLAIKKKLKSVSIVNDQQNKPFGDTLISGFKPLYEPYGTIKSVIDYNSSTKPQYVQMANEAARNNPEAIIIIASAIDTALLTQHLKMILPDVTVFVSPWSMSKELIASGGKSVEGILAYIPFDKMSSRNEYLEFVGSYKDRFGEAPPFVSAFNYEAVQLIWRGITDISATDPLRLKNYLLGLESISGLQSDFKLDQNGDAQRPLYLYQIKDQKISRVE